MAEKKQELEKRLQDVTGQLGTAKKNAKKGMYRFDGAFIRGFVSGFSTKYRILELMGSTKKLLKHPGMTRWRPVADTSCW